MDGPGRGAGQPLPLLLVGAELGDQPGGGPVGGQRDRGDPAADLDQHPGQLDQAEPGAVVLLGEREPEQPGGAELGPEVGVEPVAGRLDGLHPLVGGAVLEDPRGQLGGLVLLGGEGEVHVRVSSCAARGGRGRRTR